MVRKYSKAAVGTSSKSKPASEGDEEEKEMTLICLTDKTEASSDETLQTPGRGFDFSLT